MIDSVIISAFRDELEKISVSRKQMTVPQTRKGRRPMRVDTMLKKDKEGTLYKHTKAASDDYTLYRNLINADHLSPIKAMLSIETMNKIEKSKRAAANSDPKRKKGDVPSREDVSATPIAENRQTMQGTVMPLSSGEKFHAPEGFMGY